MDQFQRQEGNFESLTVLQTNAKSTMTVCLSESVFEGWGICCRLRVLGSSCSVGNADSSY
jgi:hypothetical protein